MKMKMNLKTGVEEAKGVVPKTLCLEGTIQRQLSFVLRRDR